MTFWCGVEGCEEINKHLRVPVKMTPLMERD